MTIPEIMAPWRNDFVTSGGIRVSGYYPPILENQKEKKIEDEMQTAIIYRVI